MGENSILDYLRGKDYDVALMTTFNFEIEFFERFVLNQLYDNNIRKISLFVDAKELNKSIMNVDSSYLGKRYFVTPIEMPSSFHPKVFLLLGKKKARLIVGSANLTRTGLMSNNEIYNVFDYDDKNMENLSLIKDAMKFFLKLHRINETENDLFEELSFISYLNKNAPNDETYFLDNIETSILEQISHLIPNEVISIDIAVPYYDNELLALKEIINKYPNSSIKLYIQNKMSTFNVRYNKENKVLSENNILPFSKCDCNDSNNFYHGKVIRFNTNAKSYILYGSTNCTLSALSNSYKQDGNIECDIFEIGDINEFDYFFNNFVIDYPEVLENQTMYFEHQPDNNFTFKYIEEDLTLTIFLGYKKKIENLKITLDEELIQYNYIDNKLIVLLPLELLSHVDNLFSINISYNDKTEIIKCWYNNIQSITMFREISNEKSVTKIKIPDEGTIFMKDEELLIRTMTDDPKEIELARMQMKRTKIENDEPDEDDSFAIDDDIEDEYVRKYKEYEHVNKCIKKLATHYFRSLTQNKDKGSKIPTFKIAGDQNPEGEKTTHIRKATGPEKRFEKLVKSKVDDLLTPNNYNKKTYEEYRDLIGFFFGIFDKYKYQEKIEDIFQDKYVIETKFKLLEILLSKSNEDNINEHKEDNIIMTLMIIIETNYINNLQDQNDYKVETKNKNLLKQINSLYNIRNNFKDYLEIAINYINERTIDIVKEIKSRKAEESLITLEDVYLIRDIIPINHAINIIERLYGYKTQNQLLELIKDFYGNDCLITIANENINIESQVSDIGKYMSIEESTFKQMLKEIKNYSKNVSNIESLSCLINIDKERGLIKIEYKININTGKMKRKRYYTNSEPQEDEYIIRII